MSSNLALARLFFLSENIIKDLDLSNDLEMRTRWLCFGEKMFRGEDVSGIRTRE